MLRVAGGVDQDGIVLHHGEGVRVQHMLSLRSSGNVERHDIGLAQQCLHLYFSGAQFRNPFGAPIRIADQNFLSSNAFNSRITFRPTWRSMIPTVAPYNSRTGGCQAHDSARANSAPGRQPPLPGYPARPQRSFSPTIMQPTVISATLTAIAADALVTVMLRSQILGNRDDTFHRAGAIRHNGEIRGPGRGSRQSTVGSLERLHRRAYLQEISCVLSKAGPGRVNHYVPNFVELCKCFRAKQFVNDKILKQ